MQVEPIVRPATAEDMSAIGEVAEATGLFPADMLPDMIAGYLHDEKDEAADIWLGATLHGSLIGFVFCEPERLTNRTWNMRAIGVMPGNQGKGVGAMLTLALESALRERDARLLVVETTNAEDQLGARSFYNANGYQEEAKIREFWDTGIDKVVFRKKL